MPKRTDIKKILLIGSGPIVIGQAAEFDYSGTQGCRALKEEGYEVILVNSNPATIMTDPEIGDKTYIEPLTLEVLTAIIEKEKPDAILPTLGGQTALNLTINLHKAGVLAKNGVKLIGANIEAIEKAEDRSLFKKAMERIGLQMPKGGFAYNMKEAEELMEYVGFPAIIRPSFTLGGTGGNIAYNKDEYTAYCRWGLDNSPSTEILIEESIIGWKEFELEVIRDKNDNVIIVCSIENFDPMGVHTGDSITVAPIQTLTDKEYQKMRTAAIKVIREIGVETGGSNIQFAVNPHNGNMTVIEMNPRVSRSSALASKATGFPIAKVAAKLAIGYTLDELQNDITGKSACFEPALDYCVVKIPRFTFEKFPTVEDKLTTQMKSVGEVMAIGRTFLEALQKGLRSMERNYMGLDTLSLPSKQDDLQEISWSEQKRHIIEMLRTPNSKRIFYIKSAFIKGLPIETIYNVTGIDKWFLSEIKRLTEFEKQLEDEASKQDYKIDKIDIEMLYEAKRHGFSDKQLAVIFKTGEDALRKHRLKNGIKAVFKSVDTCAGEFEAFTPYYYSTYEVKSYFYSQTNRSSKDADSEILILDGNEYRSSDKEKIIILGSGPNRIGQGIEFDYCCVHTVSALNEMGYETIMVNNNPETVSTDYDISGKLFFEPITLEDVMNIVEQVKPKGVIVQVGGQTPLKLVNDLQRLGVPILGTQPDSIDTAENREKFGNLMHKLQIRQPTYETGYNYQQVKEKAKNIGYPIIVRPSYVIGGSAMEIVYDDEALKEYISNAAEVSPGHPVLIDKFLEDAIEVDVDAICDGEMVVIGAIMQHIEEAGIHSGDSACSIPSISITEPLLDNIREWTKKIALGLKVLGLINIQFAIKDDLLYVLEVNPRASRTIPFVSKAIGIPLAKIAAKVMLGKSLKELNYTEEKTIDYYCVKEVVLPFVKFPGADILLGPEMRSTGEVMGIDKTFGVAFAKSQMAAFVPLPLKGTAFISVNDNDKPKVIDIAQGFADLGFKILATWGTWKFLLSHNIPAERVFKINEGRPDVLDAIKNSSIDIILNTPFDKKSERDDRYIRSNAVARNIPCITTTAAARAAVNGIRQISTDRLTICSLNEYHS